MAAYEAMKVLLYAIEHAENPTGEGILPAMKNIEQFSGVFGEWKFDSRGDTLIQAIGGMQIQNGTWSFVQVVE